MSKVLSALKEFEKLKAIAYPLLDPEAAKQFDITSAALMAMRRPSNPNAVAAVKAAAERRRAEEIFCVVKERKGLRPTRLYVKSWDVISQITGLSIPSLRTSFSSEKILRRGGAFGIAVERVTEKDIKLKILSKNEFLSEFNKITSD